MYQFIVSATKISIVLLYLRIFPKEISKRFTYVSWTVIAGLVVYFLAFSIYFAVQCVPLNYYWNQWDGEHEGFCRDIQLAAWVNSGANIFFDLVVFFLPIPKLMKLQVREKRRKVGVILTFLVGLFVTLCSIIRLQYIAQVGKYTNATYHYNDVGFWTGLELYSGIICACMPSIAGPLMYFFRNTVGSKISSWTSSYNSRYDSKYGTHQSRTEHDKSAIGAARLPSRASERTEEVELTDHTQKRGSAEKTTATTMYDLPGDQTSSDDVEMIYHDTLRDASDGRDKFGV